MGLFWDDRAWEEYCDWLSKDRRTIKRINAIITDIQRNPFSGIAKPEPLIGNLSGWWSRRIDDSNRIVYKKADDSIIIASCKGHYNE